MTSASFSPSGQQIVTASRDGTARVWEVETGECKQELAGHSGRVTYASFSPSGQQIVTASDDGTARVCNADRNSQGLMDALNVAGVKLPSDVAEDIIGSLPVECDRAVRRKKLDVVWRWVAPLGQGTLGLEEVKRIANAIGRQHGEVLDMLGLHALGEVTISKQQLEEATTGASLVDEVCARQMLPLLELETSCLDFMCAC
eukprot:COSAG02_NODE_7510_length_2978_cov_2.202154_4_plen_201_part_00